MFILLLPQDKYEEVNDGSGRIFFYLYPQNSSLSSYSCHQPHTYLNPVFYSHIFLSKKSEFISHPPHTINSKFLSYVESDYNNPLLIVSYFCSCPPKLCPMSTSLEAGINSLVEEVPSYAYHPPHSPQGTSFTLSDPLQDLGAGISQVVILRFIYYNSHLENFLSRHIFMVLFACGNSRQ